MYDSSDFNVCPDLSSKTVDLDQSFLDCDSLSLHLVLTRTGRVESLLQLATSNTRGLQVSGWLESREGRSHTWSCPGGERGEQRGELVFTIRPGANYQLGTSQRRPLSSIEIL